MPWQLVYVYAVFAFRTYCTSGSWWVGNAIFAQLPLLVRSQDEASRDKVGICC